MKARVPLAGGFAAVTEADWRAAVSRFSKGTDRDLAALSDDSIAIGPIYQRVAGAMPVAGRPPGQRWRILSRVSAPGTNEALSLCREEVAGGADGIALVFAESIHPLKSRMPAAAAAGIAAGLTEMLADGTGLTIDAGPRTPEIAPAFAAIAAERRLTVGLACDPVAAVAVGRLPEAKAVVAKLVRLAETFTGTLALADGRVWHAAGASEAQELAAVLATVIEHLRLFEAHGLAPDGAAAQIGVALAADTDQFLTIAKLRAMRLLLKRALEAADIDHVLPIHAETAWRTMSRREPRMNVLRATGAAFAAAVGGADSITVLPFDAFDGTSSAAARRLARNTQIVIAEEAELYRFADPAAGSGAVETLTDALAENAWARFQAIEAEGGILKALAAGSLQGEIAATREARLARMAEGAIEMIGVNAFVDGDDAPLPSGGEPSADADGALVFRRLADVVEAAL